MSAKQHLRRLLWPTILTFISLGLVLFPSQLAGLFGDGEMLPLAVTALAYFAAAWLVSRIAAMALDQAAARRKPYPRLLKDMVAALLFLMAFVATTSLYMGKGAFGALAGSGLILALLGFAVRNVVADTLSGVALGVEGPFRIGDWVDIDGLARGKVIEIGWRTTRLLTRDRTYMILPNSQIARQRITNYSAPKPEYRAQVSITLDHSMPISRAREVMLEALQAADLIQKDPAPDVRVLAYEEAGITYALRYWLSRFDRDIDCRDEVFTRVDDALRRAGSIAPHRRIEVISQADETLSKVRPPDLPSE
ncbi:mechanosensitive ion channel family protein [Primorskyibacter flagellatus]|uniref:Small-conductance mechanosensitive channel n=1 Tax=Primorskyibacter flagellatus TaxID=1387277 RepID=A0A1W2DDE4_9RHOB|nr:mechanosensitive ion channel family protein [Primorskyibacter flagellatus]SMC95487.1 Small-conductance mechanosensitive channel [Primorskyibacter flagellatus]